MIENEQQLAEIMPEEPPEQTIATIASIGTSGIVLDFGEKEYSCNQGIKFSVGQRVLVEKRSGTYIVVCPIGAPITELVANKATYADSAGTAETATTATNAINATNADNATNAESAETADSVQSPLSSSQKIQFSVTAGNLAFRVGTGAWTTLQNA